jgi:MFS family permease
MSALLLTDRQIGLIASLSMLFMALSALFSGAITDKLGRKTTTLIFDVLAWSIPCLLWAFSQNFWWFMIAAAFNGLMQVTHNSWNCLLVEDAEKSAIVKMYTLVHLSNQLAIIFAPLAGLLVDRLSLVSAVRILYLFSFVFMTVKFIILYKFCDETQIGKVRKQETAGQSLFSVMAGYGQIFRRIFASPDMRFAVVLSAILGVTNMIMSNFFGLYTTGNLQMPEHYLAYLPILRSVVTVLFLFVILPRLSRFGFRSLMLAGLLLLAASHVVLVLAPGGNLLAPVLYIFIEACAYCLVMPRRDSLLVLLVDPEERARIISIVTVITLVSSIPFGYLAGWLSDMDRRLPFLLDIVLFALLFVIITASKKLLASKDKERS